MVKIGFQKNKINRPHSSLRLVDRKRKQLLLRLQLAGLFVIAVIGGLSYLSYDSSRAITNVQVVGIDSINQENISSLVSGELQVHTPSYLQNVIIGYIQRMKLRDKSISNLQR